MSHKSPPGLIVDMIFSKLSDLKASACFEPLVIPIEHTRRSLSQISARPQQQLVHAHIGAARKRSTDRNCLRARYLPASLLVSRADRSLRRSCPVPLLLRASVVALARSSRFGAWFVSGDLVHCSCIWSQVGAYDLRKICYFSRRLVSDILG